MARLLPANLSDLTLSLGETAELRTLAHLRAELSADYVVFHSVHWSRDGGNRISIGEADFIIVNRAGESLVIEQKSGQLEETAYGLVKRYANEQKDVSKQIHRTLNGIREQFKRQSQGHLVVDYLIYCPDYRVKDLSAVGLAASRIVDARDGGKLADRVKAVLGAGDRQEEGRRVLRFFENSFHLVPDVHAHVEAGERAMVRLTGGLVDVVASLEMVPFRLRVIGTAGCGKTAVAARYAEASVNRGRKALLICFNRPLAEKLRLSVGATVTVETFYGFMDRFLKQRGHSLEYGRMSEDGFWLDVQERVINEPIDEDWIFDALIVDEGQDIEPEWIDILRMFVRPEADILWLEDGDQSIRSRGEPIEKLSRFEAPFVTYRVRNNYRSPQTIAEFIARSLPFSFFASNPEIGLGVGISVYRKIEDVTSRVSATITELLRRGFRHDEIVIISIRGLGRASFAKLNRIGSYTLARPTGAYDRSGNQLLEAGQIRFDTVYRFKGQQSPAVIVMDIDAENDDLTHAQKLLFSAMTRATVRLELIVAEGGYWHQTMAQSLLA